MATWTLVPAADIKPGDMIEVLGVWPKKHRVVAAVVRSNFKPIVRIYFEGGNDEPAEYESWFQLPRLTP